MHEGGSNSVVESQPSKLLVAGSIPVSRSNLCPADAAIGEFAAERGHGWRAATRFEQARTDVADVSAAAAKRRRPM